MNLILLFDEDFIEPDLVRLTGRRLEHVTNVHRAAAGDELVVGVANGKMGTGVVTRLDRDALELRVTLDRDPPPALLLTLVLALPRPKVLNRVIAATTSLGVKRIFLINAWRVEKSYWKSPRLSEENLLRQRILGLEQARDTMLPVIELRRLFRPFVEDDLPSIAAGSLALVAHPGALHVMPSVSRGTRAGGAAMDEPVRATRAPDPSTHARDDRITLAVGPEAGFIEEEIASLARIGFTPVSIGDRVLRVETAVAALLGRLF